MGGLIFISIRRLRAPLVVIIVIFAVATAGMTLIPGVDADGTVWHPTLFEAFYLVTYTATTIGFGELPHPFTDVQRLWVTIVIYMSVIGWAYLLGNILGLVQDRGFRAAIVAGRFARSVRRLREPFYLLCGLGETGIMVAHALDEAGRRFVALDEDEIRTTELDLGEFLTDPPALAADATSPETLVRAGLLKRQCRGVFALMPNDHANLAVAVAAGLLHPGLRTICAAHSPELMQAMETAGASEIVNPYREFAERLAIAMRAPDTHRLLTWLSGPPGRPLPPRVPAPPGRWIVCGYGRFGTEVVAALRDGGFEVTVVDPDAEPVAGLDIVRGHGGDAATLAEAGLAAASGLVAGSDDDVANLTMAMAARQTRPDIFVILRQNLARNRRLFAACGAEMTMVSSEIIAAACIAAVRTPQLPAFLRRLRGRDDAWAGALVARLEPIVRQAAPEVWSVRIDATEAPGLIDAAGRLGAPVRLGALLRDPQNRARRLPCLALVVGGAAGPADLPDDETEIREGDRLLLAGRGRAERLLTETLRNANAADYVLTGLDPASGLLGRLIAPRRAPRLDRGAGTDGGTRT